MILEYETDLEGWELFFYKYSLKVMVLYSIIAALTTTFVLGISATYQVFIKFYGQGESKLIETNKSFELMEGDYELNKLVRRLETGKIGEIGKIKDGDEISSSSLEIGLSFLSKEELD